MLFRRVSHRQPDALAGTTRRHEILAVNGCQ